MRNYRKKRPDVFQAEQWFPGVEVPGVHTELYVGRQLVRPFPAHVQSGPRAAGVVVLHPGDWVLYHPATAGYTVCPAADFPDAYEPADPEPQGAPN